MNATWRLLCDDSVSAFEGLALDEALMERYARGKPNTAPTLRLYSYRDHCALVGRYQNLEAEVDLVACAEGGIQVSRRLTGGGAIIMGSHQLGLAFVDRAPANKRPREIIEEFSSAIAACLGRLGIAATFRGKNDLEVNGRKIAGLGVHVDANGAMLFHASILADLDVALMLRVLRIPAANLGARAAAAVSERVTTVATETGAPCDAAALRSVVAEGLADAFDVAFELQSPDEREQRRTVELARDRYAAQSWLDERSVASDASGSARLKTSAGLMTIYLTTHGDLVKSALVVGDLNELPAQLVAMESGLRWGRLEPNGIIKIITRSGAADAVGVTNEQLTRAVLEAGRQALERSTAAPVRSVGSCYFPEPTADVEVRASTSPVGGSE